MCSRAMYCLQDVAIGAAKTLMGTSPVYSTSSSALFSLLSIPPTQLTFVTFKAHSRDPYDQLVVPLGGTGSTARQRVEAARHWLRSAKLPLVTELSGATYPELMPSDVKVYGPGGKALLPPLVGLAVLSRRGLGADGLERAKDQVDKMAKAWVVQRREARRNGGAEEQERDVLWAWVDGDKWAGWARSIYDVKMGAKDGPKVVVADPKVTFALLGHSSVSSLLTRITRSASSTGRRRSKANRSASTRRRCLKSFDRGPTSVGSNRSRRGSSSSGSHS